MRCEGGVEARGNEGVGLRASGAAAPEFHEETVASMQDLSGWRGFMRVRMCERAADGQGSRYPNVIDGSKLAKLPPRCFL